MGKRDDCFSAVFVGVSMERGWDTDDMAPNGRLYYYIIRSG